jgi:hypothetical protein
MPDTHPDDKSEIVTPEQEHRDRRSANIFLLVAAVAFVAIGLWIGEGLLKAKRADDCMSSGRRNCSPIEVPLDPNAPQPRVVDPRP